MSCCSKRRDDTGGKDDGLRPAGFIPIDASRWRTGAQKVPSRIENLNKEWLTEALRLKGHLTPDGRVTSVEVRPIGEGLGMMADMALLHLTLEGELPGAPHRMVAKFAPQKQDKLPKFIVKFQLRNEAHFYNDFTVAAGGLPRPACYLAAERRRGKPTFLMLLEIVDDAATYTRIGGCDVAEHLERAVGALAGLHSRWWNHPRKAPLQWALHPHQGLGRFLFSRQYFAYSLSKALRAMRVWEPETFAPLLDWAELLTRAAPLVVKQCTTPPFTLVHGDAHLDNIFFAERFPGGCAFIDHANMMLAKPLLDVAFFLGTYSIAIVSIVSSECGKCSRCSTWPSSSVRAAGCNPAGWRLQPHAYQRLQPHAYPVCSSRHEPPPRCAPRARGCTPPPLPRHPCRRRGGGLLVGGVLDRLPLGDAAVPLRLRMVRALPRSTTFVARPSKQIDRHALQLRSGPLEAHPPADEVPCLPPNLGSFVVQDYAKQKSHQKGVFAADQASVSKAERNLARVYSGDGPSSPGFNGRLVTALVDLKCDELLRDALSRAGADGGSSCCGGAPAATPADRQMCADAAAAVAAPPSAAPAEAV